MKRSTKIRIYKRYIKVLNRMTIRQRYRRLLFLATFITIITVDLSNIRNVYMYENYYEKPQDDMYVTVTVYNPVKEQCNADPLHTADMSYIDTNLLKDRKIRWIAVSRDLIGTFCEFGDTVVIVSDNEYISGEWVVHDLMNKRFEKRIDILSDKMYNKKIGKIKGVLVKKHS